jgi:plasmid maintenance system antidote protein VapI
VVGRLYRCGATSKELAKRCGFTAPYVSMLLNGKKRLTDETKLKLFSALAELEKEAQDEYED